MGRKGRVQYGSPSIHRFQQQETDRITIAWMCTLQTLAELHYMHVSSTPADDVERTAE